MFKFDNTHIFTGYLKQMLSSFNLPACRIYTKEFAKYYSQNREEDPRVIESFDTISYTSTNSQNEARNEKVYKTKQRIASRVNYLKNNEPFTYLWKYEQEALDNTNNKKLDTTWKKSSTIFYESDKRKHMLTKTLKSPGCVYDTATHEYLGDYLRFLRDYYDINLMSLYNCFNNKICNNLNYKFNITKLNVKTEPEDTSTETKPKADLYAEFNSQDSKYHIYAFPVKLFSNYTIAIDCSQDIEMFCGFYNITLDESDKAKDLFTKTYKKFHKTFFSQPFLYDKLDVKNWNLVTDCEKLLVQGEYYFPKMFIEDKITRWDIANREQDLKLFIKVPVSCRSSIVVLEGDFRHFNDFKFAPYNGSLRYQQNHAIINFGDETDKIDLNQNPFKPISKLQLLAFNTGESYPFADRLVEYLSKSAITPIDEIPDNIKRAQKIMNANKHYFQIAGLWEDKMQKIIYDCLMNSGPIEVTKNSQGKDKLIDKRWGYLSKLGYNSKSTLYDILGFIDKDAEKRYANWTLDGTKIKMRCNIQNVDIYDGLFDNIEKN